MKQVEKIWADLSAKQVELSEEQKVELGIAQDFLQEYKEAQTKFDDGASAIDRASELSKKAQKTYLQIEKMSKDLGVSVDNKITSLNSNLDFYIKAAQKIK